MSRASCLVSGIERICVLRKTEMQIVINGKQKETKSKRNEPRGKRKRGGVRRGAGHT